MKHLFVAVITSFIIPFCFSQSPEIAVAWGSVNKGGTGELLTGDSKDGYFIYWKDLYYLTYMKFDKSLQLLSEKKITLKQEGKDLLIAELIRAGDKLYALAHKYEKGDVFKVYYAALDENGTAGALSEAASFKEKGKSKTCVSKNGSKIALADFDFESGYDIKRYSINVYNADFSSVYKTTLDIPNKNEGAGDEGIQVSDDGDVYLIHRIWESDKDKNKNRNNYKFKVYHCHSAGNREMVIDLKDNNHPSYARLIPAGSGEFFLTGFYNAKSNPVFDHQGVFLYKRNAITGNILLNNQFPLDKNKITDLLRDSDIYKEKLLTNFEVTGAFQTPDEGTVFISEENYWFSIPHSTGTTIYYSKYVYTDDLLVSKFAADGNLLWIAKVPKVFFQQETANSQSSYYYISKGDEIYLFYNTLKTKDERASSGKSAPHTITNPAIYTDFTVVDSNGKTDSKTILTNKEEGKMLLNVQWLNQLSNDKILIMRSSNKFQLGIITLK